VWRCWAGCCEASRPSNACTQWVLAQVLKRLPTLKKLDGDLIPEKMRQIAASGGVLPPSQPTPQPPPTPDAKSSD
jgi:hypothetical protein